MLCIQVPLIVEPFCCPSTPIWFCRVEFRSSCFIHLRSPLLVLLSLGRRLGTPPGLTGVVSSQRPGVERPWGTVPGSCSLGHPCYVYFYGLLYDQASCAVWSLLPTTLAARNKSKPSKWILVASLSTLKQHLFFLCVLLVDKFKWVLCCYCIKSVWYKSSPSCWAVLSVMRICVFRSGSLSQLPRWLS